MSCCLPTAQAQLSVVNPVDGRVAEGGAADDVDTGFRAKA